MRNNILLFTVGPVEMDTQILKLGSKKLPYFRTENFSKINIEIAEIMKNITYTRTKSELILLTASGSGAMEAAIINTFTDKDKLLIVNGGDFGQRFVDICSIFNIPYAEIRLQMGKTLKKADLLPYTGKGFTGFLTNALETSTGVYYDIPMIGEFCKKENMILIVDAISSFLADPYFMDEWNVDMTIISSQKGLALPPGLSFLIINEKTIQKIKSTPIRSLYFDINSYIENMKRGQTPFTPAIGIILQLHARLKQIQQKGTKYIIKNTKHIAETFRSQIKELPFNIPSEKLSNALTPLTPQSDISAEVITKYLRDKYNIFLNPNGGNSKHNLFRVGHLGNLTLEDNTFLISAFKEMEKEGLL